MAAPYDPVVVMLEGFSRREAPRATAVTAPLIGRREGRVVGALDRGRVVGIAIVGIAVGECYLRGWHF